MNKFLSIVILALASAQAVAGGYVTAGDGSIVKTGSDLCLRTGYYSSEDAVKGCDPVATVNPIMTKVSLQAETLFDFDRAVIKPQGMVVLDSLVAKIQTTKVDAIIATGHTDSVGTDNYNMKLGLRRADAVAKYLAAKGVTNVYVSSKGESQPVASNNTAEGRAKNRRVDLEVIGTTK